MGDDAGTAALHAVEKLLRDKPNKVGHDFAEATRRLAVFRDDLIAHWRQTHAEIARRRLARANAILSVIVGGQFPINAVPWEHIEAAHNDLAALLVEVSAA